MSLKRHRVVLRSKVRGHRLRQRGVAGAMFFLAVLAAVTIRHAAPARPSWAAVKARFLPAVKTVEIEGLPEPLRARVLAYLDLRTGGPQAATPEELSSRFDFLKSARIRRDWRGASLRFELGAHEALGRVVSRGRPAGYLSESGTVFQAPDGIFAAELPVLEIGAAKADELKALSEYLKAVAKTEALPSPLDRLRWVSAGDGWEARLKDGTAVLWGKFDFTAQKISRLRDVLADARGRYPGALAADLRYFEDGKVLLRPLGSKAVSLR